MINLKCKVCGGPLRLVSGQVAECEQCGSKMLLPMIDSDVRNDMFNRGNYYRMNYEFERAASAFEQIVARDPEDAEARFCLALCHFGVEYVRDPRSGAYKPTCHRSNASSILEDVDYQAALRCAPAQAQAFYRQQAAEIHEIWQHIMEIARYEEPYDVFICYKESPGTGTDPQQRAAAGERTRDSVLAQDLYEELTQRGLRVFFSRISLEDKLGSAYEPYIFAALQSAKVMLVVGTRRDYIGSVWVKNEWQRYLSLRQQDRSREVIPVLEGMDEYDLPDELAEFIPRRLDQTGVKQDLIRGVLKITGHTEGSIEMIRNRELAQLAQKLLNQQNWEQAAAAAHQMLNLNPDNGEAYRILFLAGVRVSELNACKELCMAFEQQSDFIRLQKYAQGPLKKEVDGLVAYRKKREKFKEGQKKQRGKQFEAAYQLFQAAGDYPGAAESAAKCQKKAEEEKQARVLNDNVQKYTKAVQDAEREVQEDWRTLAPDMAARFDRVNREMTPVKRPKAAMALVLMTVILLFAGVWGLCLNMLPVKSLARAESDPFFTYDFVYGVTLFVYVCVLLFYFGYRRLCENINKGIVAVILVVISFWSTQGIESLQYVVINKLFPTLNGALSESAYQIGLAAVNFVLMLIVFLVRAGSYLRAGNRKQEREHFNDVELPAYKQQLLARRLEYLRGEYEPFIGAENCRRYAQPVLEKTK